MVKNGEIAEFRGEVKQHLKDVDSNLYEIKKDVKSLNKRYWIILILLSVAVIERLPTIVQLAGVVGK